MDSGLRLHIPLPAQTITLDLPRTARAQLVVARAFVHDHRVGEGDPGDVRSFDHDRDVAFRGNDSATDMFRAEIVARDECVLVGAYVVIIVGPILDTAPAIEARLRRQWRPANIIFIGAPGDPGRSPFIARHPDPTDFAQPHPTAVVIRRPAKWLVRNPGPAGVAVGPAAFGIGTPVARRFRFTRLPYVTVIIRLQPFAVRFEFFVKHSVGGGGTLFGPRFRFLGHFLDWSCFLDRSGARLRHHLLLGQGLLTRF